MSHDIRKLDGSDLVRALQDLGLYPVPCHAVFFTNGIASCTCSRGARCGTPGKHPVGSGWQVQSREEALLRLEKFLDRNIGHVTGRISQTVILDVDGGARDLAGGRVVMKNGYASLTVLEARLGVLPPTVSWVTGSGAGEQRLFSVPPGVVMPRNSAGRLGQDIDIRGEGGFGVLPPSNHRSGGRYRWKDGLAPGAVGIAALPPAWLDALLVLMPAPPPAPVVPPRGPAAEGDQARAVKRATAYVAQMGPAVSGHGGHDHTFNVACRVVERVLDEDDAWAVLADWNRTCEPPWFDCDLRHKLRDALRKHALGEQAGETFHTRKAEKPAVNITLLTRLLKKS